ncbi:MAG: amidophosphoribosyltransferase [Armatimonadota bacterium]|jgi:amidophosphoribosyltransferase
MDENQSLSARLRACGACDGFDVCSRVPTRGYAAADAPREACGVFGIFAPGEDVSRLTYFGLFALQHRGQESAGIAVSDGHRIDSFREMGLVSQVFDEETLERLRGVMAIGHTRYSTTGSSTLANAQPMVGEWRGGKVALAHNGNLINAVSLRQELEAQGETFDATSDSEIMLKMVVRAADKTNSVEDAVAACMPKWQGAYSLTILTERAVMAVRDPWRVRPLCIGRLNGSSTIFASESCALSVIGAELIREVAPGEIVIVDADGLRSRQAVPESRPALCVFEYIYMARPDSVIGEHLVHEVRRRLGMQLAEDSPADGDVVMPVPDTGWPAAIGFAERSGLPFGEGLIRNRYIPRTFIQPDQRLREMGVKIKLNPLKEALRGRRVVLVDDSIVRGTTKRGIISMIRDAGAKEVHIRITAPPYRWPCYYGVDTSSRSELIAAREDTVEGIRKAIGADTLSYQSVEGLLKALRVSHGTLCMACFTGEYPISIPQDVKLSKLDLEGRACRRREDAPEARTAGPSHIETPA